MFKKVVFITLFFVSFTFHQIVYAETNTQNIDQAKVTATVKQAESYIKKNGIQKAIETFRKNSQDIFMGDYSGRFYVSPLHPELLGGNQFNYKDPTGAYPVQEEIHKAQAGGGWLQGRWRRNPENGKYQCRKIYILPVQGTQYYIGSWYHYVSNKEGICLT